MNLFDLSGKTALVTGAKRGIGRAMAEALAEAGADIVGVSANLELQGSEVGESVTARGRSFAAYQCDFNDRQAVHGFAAQLDHDGVAPDILINNAGTIRRKPAVEHDDALWDEVIEVNLSAQFILSREIGRGMVSRKAGKIIFTASLLTFQGGITVPQDDEARSKSILERIPAGRWGKPGDFAGPAVFLSSSASDYVHGTILTVDGGWMGR